MAADESPFIQPSRKRNASVRAFRMNAMALCMLAACGARSGLSVATIDAAALVDGTTPLPDGAPLLDQIAPPVDASSCPRGVLTTTSAATDFAINGAFLYYVDSAAGGISRVPKTGGASELIVPESRPIHNVVADDRFVYWSSGTVTAGSFVYRAPKTPPGAPVILSSTKHYLDEARNPDRFTYPISVNDRFVSWAKPMDGAEWVDTTNVTSTGRTPLNPPFPIAYTPRLGDVRSDATHVYWVGGEFLARSLFANSGGPEVVFRVSLDRMRAFTIDDSDIYWTVFNGSDSSVLRTSKADISLETTFVDHVSGTAIAADADSVYVTAAAGIVKVSKSTRATTVVESANGDARSIAVDAECVYYLSSGEPNAMIVRVPK